MSGPTSDSSYCARWIVSRQGQARTAKGVLLHIWCSSKSGSPDGTAWHLEYVEAASSFWTSAPNQWGLFINTNNNSTPNLVTRCDFIDWDE